MKILMINSVCGIRSTGRICTDIAQELERRGHECKIAYGRETVPEKFKRYSLKIGTSLDVKLHGLKARVLDACGLGSKSATKKFIKWVKEYNPDVIHLHNLHGYYINIEVLFKYLAEAGKPVVWTMHDCWAFTGHCSHFGSAKCERWKTGCYACPKKKSYPTSIFLDNSKRNYALKKALFTAVKNLTVVTPSRWLADIVAQSFFNGYPIKVIHNGINLDVFKPTESDFRERLGLGDKRLYLGVASAWHKGKGLHDMISISERLPESAKLILVGLTEEQLGDIPDQILGITRTNNIEELAQIYSAANVFLNTTYSDTYPTVNLEAQACGTPVVTYRTGGSPEGTVEENVVDQGDIDALLALAERDDLRCLERESLSLSAMASSYADLYSQLV